MTPSPEPSELLAALDRLRAEDLRFISAAGRTIVAFADDETVDLLRRSFPQANVELRTESAIGAVITVESGAGRLCIAPTDAAEVGNGSVRLEPLTDRLSLYASIDYLLGDRVERGRERAAELLAAERRRVRELERELAAEWRLRIEQADEAQRFRALLDETGGGLRSAQVTSAQDSVHLAELGRLRLELDDVRRRCDALVASRRWRYTGPLAALAARLRRLRA